MIIGALGVVTGEQLDGRVLAHDDEQTALHHHIERGIEDIDQLDGALSNDAVGHVDEQAILHEQAVEGDRRVAQPCEAAIMACHQFGMVHRRHAERLNDHLTDVALSRGTAMESVVARVVQASAHVGHVAVECLGRVSVKGQTVNVHAIVMGEYRLEVCCLIVLAALAGKTGVLEMLAGDTTQLVEQRR